MSPLGYSSGCGFFGACAGLVAAFLLGRVFCDGWSCLGLGQAAAVGGGTIGLLVGLIFGVTTRNSEALQSTLQMAWLIIGFLIAGVIAYQLLMPVLGN